MKEKRLIKKPWLSVGCMDIFSNVDIEKGIDLYNKEDFEEVELNEIRFKEGNYEKWTALEETCPDLISDYLDSLTDKSEFTYEQIPQENSAVFYFEEDCTLSVGEKVNELQNLIKTHFGGFLNSENIIDYDEIIYID